MGRGDIFLPLRHSQHILPLRPSDEELNALADLLNGKEDKPCLAKDAHAEVVELSGFEFSCGIFFLRVRWRYN